MESINISLQSTDWLQMLKYKLIRLGWQGLVGLLLILCSLSYLFVVANPQASQLQQLQKELAMLKASPKLAIPLSAAHSHIDVAQRFYEILPKQSEANSKIGEILRVATDNELVINKVEYEQPLTVTPLIQYQIKLPLTGSYSQIRQFINQVLNSLPSIALSGISLKRQEAMTDLVDAQIQFTLYLHKEIRKETQ